MLIASTNTRKLCLHLRTLLDTPPQRLVIGRLVAGPQKWFNWVGSNNKSVEYGWEKEYYKLVEQLKKKCRVEHFAVSMAYIQEVGEEIRLIGSTRFSSKGIVYMNPGEPMRVIHKDTDKRGYAAEEKLKFCLEHWEEVKHCFHAASYILIGEDANEEESYKDVLFHYHGSGLNKVAQSYGKEVLNIKESFVTENVEASKIINMFHGI